MERHRHLQKSIEYPPRAYARGTYPRTLQAVRCVSQVKCVMIFERKWTLALAHAQGLRWMHSEANDYRKWNTALIGVQVQVVLEVQTRRTSEYYFETAQRKR